MKKPKTNKAEKGEHKARVISAVGVFMSRTIVRKEAKRREKEKMLF